MNKLIIVSGTHGSGKSTLARQFIEAHGGVLKEIQVCGETVSLTADGKCAVLGKYATACGGIDGFSGWKALEGVITYLTEMGCPIIFGEGVIQYGKERYMWMNAIPGYEFVFIKLNVPLSICIEHVLNRRKEAGNTKEFDPKHVFDKERGWYSIYIHLLQNNVKNCYNLTFDEAVGCIGWYTREE